MLSIAGNFMDTTDMMAKLVGFGSDGASAMTGKKTGVVALLKKTARRADWCTLFGSSLGILF